MGPAEGPSPVLEMGPRGAGRILGLLKVTSALRDRSAPCTHPDSLALSSCRCGVQGGSLQSLPLYGHPLVGSTLRREGARPSPSYPNHRPALLLCGSSFLNPIPQGLYSAHFSLRKRIDASKCCCEGLSVFTPASDTLPSLSQFDTGYYRC